MQGFSMWTKNALLRLRRLILLGAHVRGTFSHVAAHGCLVCWFGVHCRLIEAPLPAPDTHTHTLYIYILAESNFNFRCIRLCDLDIPRVKWLSYFQIVETLMRRRIWLGLTNTLFRGFQTAIGNGAANEANTIKIMSSLSVYQTTVFLGKLSPLSG